MKNADLVTLTLRTHFRQKDHRGIMCAGALPDSPPVRIVVTARQAIFNHHKFIEDWPRLIAGGEPMSAFYTDRAGRIRQASDGRLTPEERELVLRGCVEKLAASDADAKMARDALKLADSVEIES